MNVLLDLNVLLDVVLDRQPFVNDAAAISDACADGRLNGYVAAISVPTLYYIVRRLTGRDAAAAAVDLCLKGFNVCAVDEPILRDARSFRGPDFEDNVQIACARRANLDLIVTRDLSDFISSPIPALSPSELLARLPALP